MTEVAAAPRSLGTTRRAAIGLLVPSANTVIEPDCYRIAPAGVTFHAARMFITETTCEALEKMTADVDLASKQLATAEVDVIAFGCTSGSFLKGAGYDAELSQRIERVSGAKATTTSSAVLEALRKLGARTIAIGTPYPDEVNSIIVRFFEDSGFRVTNMEGLQILKATDIAAPEPTTAYELGRRVDRPDADAVFLSCTNFRAAEAADQLEQDLGKPVVTSNQATAWLALRKAGITDPIEGYGRLLRDF